MMTLAPIWFKVVPLESSSPGEYSSILFVAIRLLLQTPECNVVMFISSSNYRGCCNNDEADVKCQNRDPEQIPQYKSHKSNHRVASFRMVPLIPLHVLKSHF